MRTSRSWLSEARKKNGRRKRNPIRNSTSAPGTRPLRRGRRRQQVRVAELLDPRRIGFEVLAAGLGEVVLELRDQLLGAAFQARALFGPLGLEGVPGVEHVLQLLARDAELLR